MKRAMNWTIENIIFGGFLFMAVTQGGGWEYPVNIWVGFIFVMLVLAQLVSASTEWLYGENKEPKHAVSLINKCRLRSAPVPLPIYIGLEVALAAAFISFGWYWLAAMQTYIVVGLVYIYDRELTAKAMTILEERSVDLEGKTSA